MDHPLWLLGLSVVVSICTWFVRSWFDGVKAKDDSLVKQVSRVQVENHREHGAFQEKLHALDRRLIMLEGTIPELKLAVDRLSEEFKEAVDELSSSLKDHVAVEEKWQREIATFMGEVKAHLDLRVGK